MKQSHHLPSKSSLDFYDKEASRKKPSSRDYQNESQYDESERASTSRSKIPSHFDAANFSVFFKHKNHTSRGSNDSLASRVHIKKKSNETSSSKESTLKHMSSKDFSNLEELYDNTTIINNPKESKPHSKRVSNEISIVKQQPEEGNDTFQESLTSMGKERDNLKKKLQSMSSSGIIKPPRDEKPDQVIIGTLSKLDLNGESEEQDRVETSVCRDLKFSKNNIKLELIESIMNKSLHHRRTSVYNNNLNNLSGVANISNNMSAANLTQNGQTEVRTNNNSVFNGSRKLIKGSVFPNNQLKKESSDNHLLEPFKNPGNAMYTSFEAEPTFGLPKIESQLQKPFMLKPPASIVTRSVEAQDFARKVPKTSEKSSTVATDSTIDSDHLPTMTFNHHNNSFSTLFSGTSNSFNNSGKIDFNSPLRTDSGRVNENIRKSIHSNKTNLQPLPIITSQRNLFNSVQNPIGFYGGHGSGNNTDRSSSFSWNNDEFAGSNFSSALSTPQGRQQQQHFFNQSLNIPPPSLDHHYVCNSQALGRPQTTRSKNNDSFTLPNQNMNQSMIQNMSDVSTVNFNDLNLSCSGKESKTCNPKSRKKNQEIKDSSLYEVDLKRVNSNPKTTLMVKNIPNKYDLPLLLQTIEKNHKGKYDFLYLPIDPRNKCNVGYAFINFIDTEYIKDFYTEFNAKRWEKFNSEKVCDIKYARIQGKKALMHHFQYSNVMNQQDKKLKPYIPPDYELLNNQKIKDLVYKQKLDSVGEIFENK